MGAAQVETAQRGQEPRVLAVNPNLPPRRVRALHPRHRLASVTQKTRAKPMNSVIEPTVDVAADVAAINQGRAARQGDVFTFNERRYRLEPGGRVYPVDGPGVHQLPRGAFRALGVYNRFGHAIRAETILDEMGIIPVEREAARRAWRAGQRQE